MPHQLSGVHYTHVAYYMMSSLTITIEFYEGVCHWQTHWNLTSNCTKASDSCYSL